MKKILFGLIVLLLVLSALPAPAATAQNVAMLVAPARYTVLQVAFDVARRYPTVLVSYQGSPEEPVLNAWDGHAWQQLAIEDFQSGEFLESLPGRTIFLGDDQLLPASLRSINSWCNDVVQFPNLETPNLINSIGQYLPFTPSDWRWFAGRYNLSLTNLRAEEAAAAKNQSWYDDPSPVNDPAPGFFRYFTRSRRGSRAGSDAPMIPVDVNPADVVDVSAE